MQVQLTYEEVKALISRSKLHCGIVESAATAAEPETIALGATPRRVENYAINPRLITYSLSEDGNTLIIKPCKATPEPVAQLSDAEIARKHYGVWRAQLSSYNCEIMTLLEAALAERGRQDTGAGYMLLRIRGSLQARLDGRNEGGDKVVMDLVTRLRAKALRDAAELLTVVPNTESLMISIGFVAAKLREWATEMENTIAD